MASFSTVSDTAQASIQQTDDSAISSSSAPYWHQTLGSGLGGAVKDLTIRVKNPGADAYYSGELLGYLTPDYTSGYGIPPAERYSFGNFGPSTPAGFDGYVTLTMPGGIFSSFPLNPNLYYKLSLNVGDTSRSFSIGGTAGDSYPNGKAYYSNSSYPCGPYFNPETTCGLGTNNGMADIFFNLGTAEALSGNESLVATGTAQLAGAVINGGLIAWVDGLLGEIYVYEISTGRKIRITNDNTVKPGLTLMLAGRKILWTVYLSPYSSIEKATFVYDIDTATTTEITEKIGTNITISDFDGQRIVLQTGYMSPTSIYLYDLATSRLTLIDSDDADKQGDSVSNPKISGDKILYKWFWNCGTWCGQEELRLYDISTGEKTKTGYYGFSTDYAIDGDNVVIVLYGQPSSIYRYKISTGEATLISNSFQQTTGIDISGNIVVWSDTHDIFMYDLATSKTGRTGMAPGASLQPKVSGNTVVWDDYRAVTSADIYMYKIKDDLPTPHPNIAPTLSYSQDPGYVDDGISPDDGYPSTQFTFKVIYTDTDNDPPIDIRTIVFDGSSSTTSATEVSSDAMTLDSSANATLHDGNYTNGEQYTVARYFPAGVYRYRWEWSDGKAPCGSSCYAISDGIAGGREQRFKVIENQPPIASFTFQPSNPKVGDTITFDASGSYDPDGTIVLYGWDWNTDGVTDAYSNTPSIQYSGFPAGTTTTTLRVTDDKGGVDTNTISISVEPNNQSTGTASVLDAFCSAFGGWWCGAEVYQNEKDIKIIDEWLRDKDGNNIADANLEPFYWLKGTRCAGAGTAIKQEGCLVSALDTQFKDNARHDSGLTYKAYVLSVIAEQEMVENALKRLTPGVYPYKAFAKALLKWLPSTDVGNALYNNITSKGVEDLLRASAPIIGGSTADLFGFGSSVVSLGLNAKKINETFNDINDESYLIALGGYFRNRLFGSDPHAAWVQTSCGNSNGNNDQTWWEKWFLTTNITECGPEALLRPQMSQKMLDETEIKFDEWYKKYNIENFQNAELLGNTFKQSLKNDTEILIKYAIKNAPKR